MSWGDTSILPVLPHPSATFVSSLYTSIYPTVFKDRAWLNSTLHLHHWFVTERGLGLSCWSVWGVSLSIRLCWLYAVPVWGQTHKQKSVQNQLCIDVVTLAFSDFWMLNGSTLCLCMCGCVWTRQITLSSLVFHTNVLAQKNEISCRKAKEKKQTHFINSTCHGGFFTDKMG